MYRPVADGIVNPMDDSKEGLYLMQAAQRPLQKSLIVDEIGECEPYVRRHAELFL